MKMKNVLQNENYSFKIKMFLATSNDRKRPRNFFVAIVTVIDEGNLFRLLVIVIEDGNLFRLLVAVIYR